MTKKTYKVKGMDCAACAKMIELDLEDAGIVASCNYTKEEIEVGEEISTEKLKNIVEAGGYKLMTK